MALPLAAYSTIPILVDYMNEVNADNNPYQERIDHLWLNILTHYFPLRDRFGTEREPYVEPGRKFAANVAVTNIRAGVMHKVLIVEAKAFPYNTECGWFNVYPWLGVEAKLKFYMEKARRSFGNVQTMYGMVAVGDMVCFYTMNMINNPNYVLTPFTLAGQQQVPLSIDTDRGTIHAILISISGEITTGANTY